jgi:hypothetical protein
MEMLSLTVLIATIAMLVASFFITAAVDKRIWFLLALGPALLAAASRVSAPESERLYPAS